MRDNVSSKGLQGTQNCYKDRFAHNKQMKVHICRLHRLKRYMTPFAPECYPSNQGTILSLSDEPKRGLSQVQPSPQECPSSSKDQMDVYNEEHMVRITDKLQFDLNFELGRGAASTVYKGKFENIPVAVKRINCKDNTDAGRTVKKFRTSRESKLMNILETERHSNIVGYYVSEYKHTFMYIAMELCHGTLADYVVNDDLKATYPPVNVNQNITSGVDFLHSNNIAHRDLKPENIYFITKGRCVSKFVIGDFGTSKITVDDIFSMSTSVGTFGYIAPEVWKEIEASNETNPRRTMNLSSDIFALGCVIFYAVSNGGHPYGKPGIRQNNIYRNEPPCVEKLESWLDPIRHLVVMMLDNDPEKRPTAREVIYHPALWSAERIMNFFASVSDGLQNADKVTKYNMEDPNVQINGNWAANLPPQLKLYLDTRVVGRRYTYREIRNTVCGLLRTVRNVVSHYKEFPLDVQSELGQFPAGHAELWMRVCPTLLMHVYRKVRELQIPGLCHLVSKAVSTDSKKRDIMTKSNSCQRESKTNAAEGDNYRALNDVTVYSDSSVSLLKSDSVDLEHVIPTACETEIVPDEPWQRQDENIENSLGLTTSSPASISVVNTTKSLTEVAQGTPWQRQVENIENSLCLTTSSPASISVVNTTKSLTEIAQGTPWQRQDENIENSLSLTTSSPASISAVNTTQSLTEFVPGTPWQRQDEHVDDLLSLSTRSSASLPAIDTSQSLTEFVPWKPWQGQVKNIEIALGLTTSISKAAIAFPASIPAVNTTPPFTEFVPGKPWQWQVRNSIHLCESRTRGPASIPAVDTTQPLTEFVPGKHWQRQFKNIDDLSELTTSSPASLSAVVTTQSLTDFVPGKPWQRQAKIIDNVSCLTMSSHIGTGASSVSLSAVTTIPSITDCVPGTSWHQQMDIKKVTEKLQFDFNSELGRGMCSIVYKGQFEDIPVAVKVMRCKDQADARDTVNTFTNSCERMLMNMVEKERHKNIIGHYVQEIQNNTIYLAFELYNGNLAEYVRSEVLMASYPPMMVNKDIASGVAFLHSQNIAHRDLKPENVYFLSEDGRRVKRIVIGDFGTSKCSVGDYFSMSEGGKGTLGYIAHEVLQALEQLGDDQVNPRNKMSLKADIFALGCVFYFTMSEGHHPFGSAMGRHTNIHLKRPPAIDRIEQRHNPVKELIVKMLSHTPEERPPASELPEHPAFWSAEQIIRFLVDISDVLQGQDEFTRSQMENQDVIWGGNWVINMPVHLHNHLQNFTLPNGRKIYQTYRRSVYGLLRVIRNVANHYGSFPIEAQRELGEYPAGHVELWMRLCPMLLMHVYRKASELNLPGCGQQVRRIEPSCDTQMRPRTMALQTRPELHESVSSDSGISSYPSSRRISSTDEAELTSPKIVFTANDVRQPPVGATSHGVQPQRLSDLSSSTTISEDRTLVGIDPSARMNQLSINDEVTRAELSGSSHTTLVDRPEIVRQTHSMYVHDISYWSQCAKTEIDDAKRCLPIEITGRATILCLDISESMSQGETWTQVKQFVDDVIKGLVGLSMLLPGKNLEHVSIITFGHETRVVQRLTNDWNELKTSFNRIKLGGPSPMYGGLMQAFGSVAVVANATEKSNIVLISDFKPTETTRYAGPDIQDETNNKETIQALMEVVTEFNDNVHIVFVPVGDVDQGFLELLSDVTNGERLRYSQGRELVSKLVTTRSGTAGTDMYGEVPNTSLPAIGSRVVRGPDWKYGAQDSNGPGTIIGQGQGSVVWVEWDADGHRNNYSYGLNGTYHVLLSDDRRAISEYGRLKVGNVVTGRNGQGKGVVIKVLDNDKVHVRWETGERGDYGFGNTEYEVWPWVPDEETLTSTRPTPSSSSSAYSSTSAAAAATTTTTAASGSNMIPSSFGVTPFKNKNLHSGRGRRK